MTCPREGRLIGGCKFEARYDDQPMTEAELRHGIDLAGLLVMGAIKPGSRKRYVRDVCKRCGKTIERNG